VKLILLPRAVLDLDEIREPLLARVLRRIEVLKSYPELGGRMPAPYTDFRCTVVDFFRVVYRLRENDRLEVAFIRDCRRRLPKR